MDDFDRLTKVLNTLCVISTGFVLLASFINFISFNSAALYLNLSICVSQYLAILLLNKFNYTFASRLVFAFVTPILLFINILYVGGHFGQEMIVGAIVSVSYLLFKSHKRVRNLMVATNLLAYLIPTIYLISHPPLLRSVDLPFDGIFVFLNCSVWIVIVYNIYESKFRDYLEALKISNEDLKVKTEELKRFNYVASHDLKSPLTNIINFSGLLRKDFENREFENSKEYLNFIESSSQRMKELIEGVLEVSKMNDPSQEGKELLCLNQIVEEAISNLAYEVKSQGVIINRAELPQYEGNKSDFMTLFQNLIQNGIKYNRSDKKIINIDYFIADGILNLTFQDNGIGIPDKHQEEIFKYFKRLHTQNSYPGTGIGLGLCKKIATKYDGQIEVESILGSYSKFKISLPFVEHANKVCPKSLQENNLGTATSASH